MCMFKLGFIRAFLKEESMAISKLCNIIENPDTKSISLRDFKLITLAICRFRFDWMFCTQANIKEYRKYFKQFGYFYQGKYYLNSKEECKALN
mmetsp:Transcript_41174/g.39679  ORF Transcript_41174/g.39679 Transcript_41174/m.39679 type:complete len:93 (+) Transcript_41174:162-440(+)|eukprot:CAMPEP_0170568538 /NCGR_PEP_ID=MMETSP0211-20121228/81270_1 /TAXON_ID=311385 /ORGANISM="Pseudokeronopsis sp., Strain OXSARD2" /LENGTH=92 /DNA_ID=CAMNT_0010890473 /DNA_START=509 /DNA_END=787 /DNA_ORIENTATION=-